MIILPAIYLQDGKCIRLIRGETATAQTVSEDPVSLAKRFVAQGASWIHVVDVDGAREGKPVSAPVIFRLMEEVDAQFEVGGGVRDMETVELYLSHGVGRVILGSSAIVNPAFVREAVRAYGERISVAIDARDGKAAAEGWAEQSQLDYLDLARRVEEMGVRNIIFTDISQNGAMDGPSLPLLDNLNQEVRCNVIASGGVSSLLDLIALHDLGLYGAVAGSSIYNGTLDLHTAIMACQQISKRQGPRLPEEAAKCFEKAELVPAVLLSRETGMVLALKMMDREAFSRTLSTGEVWTYSRSRRSVWKKLSGAGNPMQVVGISTDCGNAAFLVTVSTRDPACHTGEASCFHKVIPLDRP